MLNAALRSEASLRRSQRGASEIAQFIPALYILFLIVFLPLVNLGGLFVAATIQYLVTNDCVSKASTQGDYASALNTMATEAYQFQTLGLAKLITLFPQGGYVGCGNDLYVVSTNVASGAVTLSSPNKPLINSIDTGSNVYELSVKSIYSVAPLVNLSAVPLLGAVPGLGKPVTLNFTANRPVEHPGGLQIANNSGGGSGGGPTLFNRVTAPGTSFAGANNGTWYDPIIFDQIRAAGQTVVSVNVIVVLATSNVWTPAGLNVLPGQKIWIDTQAVGSWTDKVGVWPSVSANGDPSNPTFPNFAAPSLPASCLVGQFGSNTPFFVGNSLINYSPSTTGPLSMIINDGPVGTNAFADNSGAQMVRVIVVQ
jgi:hypothetical protein